MKNLTIDQRNTIENICFLRQMWCSTSEEDWGSEKHEELGIHVGELIQDLTGCCRNWLYCITWWDRIFESYLNDEEF